MDLFQDAQYPGLREYCSARAEGMRTTEARLAAEVTDSQAVRYERYYRNSNGMPKGSVGPSFGAKHIPQMRGVFN